MLLTGQRQCEATRKDGQPCQGWALPESSFCFWHSPETARAQAAARKLGGLHRRQGGGAPTLAEQMGPRTYRTLADIEALVELAIRITIGCEQSLSQARTLGYLAGVWARVHEVGDIEERLAALEAQVAGAKK